ncbi:MAG: hypothetical protein KDD06_08575 [Phaeodactylibacter sp.]|nr:hypothetical protein [Phaeodactylibacter sp.]MCB9267025.1 hypothetical protein [Lewinellaceae bacterium]MCB9289310.1 hypothetical protein [Lewinellaceae bacterium]
MLICSNCFTVNPDGAERCQHCNMKGNFRHQDDEGRAGDPQEPEFSTVRCRNCGSETPAEAEKCYECHFPLPAKASGKKTEPDFRAWRSLRVG